METWYSKELGDAITASLPSDEIKAVFQQLFIGAGRPLNMAVFTRQESEGRLHCEVTVYFSSAAKDIAKAFDAQPCEKPALTGLSLLAGIHSRGRYSSLKRIEQVIQQSIADAVRLRA